MCCYTRGLIESIKVCKHSKGEHFLSVQNLFDIGGLAVMLSFFGQEYSKHRVLMTYIYMSQCNVSDDQINSCHSILLYFVLSIALFHLFSLSTRSMCMEECKTPLLQPKIEILLQNDSKFSVSKMLIP